MTATGHAIIGTVIAAKIADPVLAAPLALASHFLADALPHWDTGYHREQKSKRKFFIQSVADVAIGFAASYALIVAFFPQTNLAYAFFMILVAQGPDWLTAPYLFFDMKFPPFSWAYRLQKAFDNPLGAPWGIVNQVVTVILIVA